MLILWIVICKQQLSHNLKLKTGIQWLVNLPISSTATVVIHKHFFLGEFSNHLSLRAPPTSPQKAWTSFDPYLYSSGSLSERGLCMLRMTHCYTNKGRTSPGCLQGGSGALNWAFWENSPRHHCSPTGTLFARISVNLITIIVLLILIWAICHITDLDAAATSVFWQLDF